MKHVKELLIPGSADVVAAGSRPSNVFADGPRPFICFADVHPKNADGLNREQVCLSCSRCS
jgi:hypothetical protein